MPDVEHNKEVDQGDNVLSEEPKDDLDTGKDTEEGELFEGEQEKDEDLDLEVKSKPDPSVAKQKQIDAWLGKVLNGEATVDDLPKNLQWLKTPILKELKKLEAIPDVESIVENKLREKEEAQEFAHLKAKLAVMDLTKSQKAELSAEFKDLAGAGVAKAKALVKAMKITGIELDSKDRDTEELRRAMAIPKGGAAPKDSDDRDPENILKKYSSSKDRVAHWEKLRKGQV